MEENNLVPFVSQWMKIQPSLFGFLHDEQKTFVRVCSWTLAERNFFQYHWCGNGRPLASRLAIFKAFILRAVMNLSSTKRLISTLRQSPALRRPCGWESVSGVPDKSTFSRTFRDFANDKLAIDVHAEFVRKALGRNGAFHVCHDSSAIEAPERGVRKPQTNEERKATELSAQRIRTADENFALLPTHCDWGRKRQCGVVESAFVRVDPESVDADLSVAGVTGFVLDDED